MRNLSRKRIGFASIAVLALGCSGKPPAYPAGGKVTFPNGKPIANGWVTFRSQDSERPVTARGHLQPDGSFRLSTYTTNDGAVAGKHQASVASAVIEDSPEPPRIDRRFASFDTSGLEFTVTNNPEQNHFELVVEPPRVIEEKTEKAEETEETEETEDKKETPAE